MMILLKKFYVKIFMKLFSPFLTEIEKIITDANKPDYLKLIERSHKAGFDYHQQMVKNNPELLKWVLKENYMSEEDND